MTPQRLQRLKATLDKRQPDLTLVTDYVHKGRNLAALMRTADAVGIGEVHGVLSDNDWQVYRNTAKGSFDYVDLQRHKNVEQALLPLKNKGYQIVAAQLCEDAVDYRQVDYTLPTALLLGAEKQGVSDEGIMMADKKIIIPMVGMTESFNVSVAASIILMEAMFQRHAQGLYDHCRLSPLAYQQLLFRWSHPKIRDFCDQHALPYPATREDGEVDDAPAWYAEARKLIAAR